MINFPETFHLFGTNSKSWEGPHNARCSKTQQNVGASVAVDFGPVIAPTKEQQGHRVRECMAANAKQNLRLKPCQYIVTSIRI